MQKHGLKRMKIILNQLKIYLVDDLIIIRSCGNLSPAEEEFAKTEEGRILLKQLKIKNQKEFVVLGY
jgi:uncharacterized protein YbcI